MQKFIRVGWFAAALLVAVNLILDNVYTTFGPSVMVLAIDTFVQLLMLVGLSCVLAAVVSAIPFKGRSYRERYKVLFPFAVALTAGLINLMLLSMITQ